MSTGHTDTPVVQQTKKSPNEGNGSGLTNKQQLKQDAMLWAEFLYAEYKREKAFKEGKA